jgi:hypothetical protein
MCGYVSPLPESYAYGICTLLVHRLTISLSTTVYVSGAYICMLGSVANAHLMSIVLVRSTPSSFSALKGYLIA